VGRVAAEAPTQAPLGILQLVKRYADSFSGPPKSPRPADRESLVALSVAS